MTRSSPSLATKIASIPEKLPSAMTTRSPAFRYGSRRGPLSMRRRICSTMRPQQARDSR